MNTSLLRSYSMNQRFSGLHTQVSTFTLLQNSHAILRPTTQGPSRNIQQHSNALQNQVYVLCQQLHHPDPQIQWKALTSLQYLLAYQPQAPRFVISESIFSILIQRIPSISVEVTQEALSTLHSLSRHPETIQRMITLNILPSLHRHLQRREMCDRTLQEGTQLLHKLLARLPYCDYTHRDVCVLVEMVTSYLESVSYAALQTLIALERDSLCDDAAMNCGRALQAVVSKIASGSASSRILHASSELLALVRPYCVRFPDETLLVVREMLRFGEEDVVVCGLETLAGALLAEDDCGDVWVHDCFQMGIVRRVLELGSRRLNQAYVIPLSQVLPLLAMWSQEQRRELLELGVVTVLRELLDAGELSVWKSVLWTTRVLLENAESCYIDSVIDSGIVSSICDLLMRDHIKCTSVICGTLEIFFQCGSIEQVTRILRICFPPICEVLLTTNNEESSYWCLLFIENCLHYGEMRPINVVVQILENQVENGDFHEVEFSGNSRIRQKAVYLLNRYFSAFDLG